MKQSQFNAAKTVLVLSLAILTGSSLTACGNKENKSTVAAPPPSGPVLPGPNGCASCPAGSQFLASAVGVHVVGGQPAFELGLEFFGQQATPYLNQQPNSSGFWNPYGSAQQYQGAIGVTGRLRVHGSPYQTCQIPPGEYPVTAQSPGVMSGSLIGQLQLIVNVGGVPMQILISQGYLNSQIGPATSSWGTQFPFRLNTMAQIQVNAPNAFGCGVVPFAFE
jgi:hypothetical protein